MHAQYTPPLERSQVKLIAMGWLRKSREQRFNELRSRGNTEHCIGCYYEWHGTCMACPENADECTAILGAQNV